MFHLAHVVFGALGAQQGIALFLGGAGAHVFLVELPADVGGTVERLACQGRLGEVFKDAGIEAHGIAVGALASAGPAGSALSATPLSCAITCWVRSARVAASVVGRPSASSRLLVCSDWAPTCAKGGLKSSRPISFGLAMSVISRLITAGA